ncbi:MAG: hypothetical protein L6416_05340 [Candidatus Omnitrophica bacterium]|nr:hypothetical protein [Candidatus Omnitrophota bacterium]
MREGRKLDSNTWRDIYHTMVPVSYCQYVVLDKGAAHRAKACIDRLKGEGYEINVEIFNNVKNFLTRFSEAIT